MGLLCSHFGAIFILVVGTFATEPDTNVPHQAHTATTQPAQEAQTPLDQGTHQVTQSANGDKTPEQREEAPNENPFNMDRSPWDIELLYQMAGSIVLVMVLLVGCWFVVRKVLPRLTHSSSKHLRVVETASLGPHKTVHLVQVGQHRLLIGASRDRVTMLTRLDDANETDSAFNEAMRKADVERPHTRSANGEGES